MDLLGARRLPFLSRRNYRIEVCHLFFWGVLVGLIEGNIGSIVVDKTFGGGNLLVAAASATPIGALLLSIIWGSLAVGRPKLKLALLFGSATALCTATVFLTPQSPAGAVMFIVQMACAQVFLSGVITLRSALWKHNYPPHVRGRITARLQAVRIIITVVALAVVSALFDRDPSLYRFIYPVAAAFGLVAMTILRRMHVRHEKAELRRLASASDSPPSSQAEAAPLTMRLVIRSLSLLRTDRRYAKYLGAQMLLGVGVQMISPVLVIIINDSYRLYWISVALIEILPKLLVFGSLRRWGALFDRMPVTRFRVFAGSCGAVGLLFGLAGTLVLIGTVSLGPALTLPVAAMLFIVRAILHGTHQGGGTLAWNLGHLHFSDRHDAELYMGVHVSLTGVRGIISPFIGVALWHTLGWGVWLVAFTLCVLSVIAQHRLSLGTPPGPRSV